ncbi:DedA family protein [Roseomonas hellenica]|uniref:DedA family protein n=1 Tax=Plastoroseomonas hellenica TaxID=2687306 RepID=A0ABS5EVF7_9PROT|nr:VTT domain-containing protein [Plastoroseomonas hellenica]MBR0663930.1 DedA family protein [Plastoroseomonas hellenica]
MTVDLAHLEALLELLLQATSLGDVFLAALVEKFLPVLPSYVLYPAIGMGAPGVWDLVLRCFVATLGSLGGAMVWYVLGAIIGPARIERLVARHGRWVLLNPRLYERMASTYRGRPLGLTFLGQLVPTVRIFQALPAGVLRLPLAPFLAATALGSFCWITALAAAGHLLHELGWAAGEAGLTVLLTLVAAEAAAALFTLLVLPAKPRCG